MATPAYDRENTTRISIKLNNRTDSDIIEWLKSMKGNGEPGGIQGYLKALIREDMKK